MVDTPNTPQTSSTHANKLIQEAYTTFTHNNRNTGFTDTDDIVNQFWNGLLTRQGKNLLTTLDSVRKSGITRGTIADR